MANEIRLNRPDLLGSTIYCILRRESDRYVWVPGNSAFEAPGTWDASRVGECDIALTESPANSGQFSADMPNVAEDEYYIEYFQQAGASPALADTDTYLGGETYQWDGHWLRPRHHEHNPNRQYGLATTVPGA